MTNQPPYQPIFILPENSQRNTGRDAQRLNIAAAKLIAETVRTTLGPKGMDKMLVDSVGEVTVTNDGVTILREMNIEHPSAKMIVEIAQTQEDEVGDGTTTAVVIAGELLKQAEKLLDQHIHPTIIAKGYRLAAEKAQEILKKLAEPVAGKPMLKQIALTAMTGKGAESHKDLLADLIVKAITHVEQEGQIIIDDIKIEKKTGGDVSATELIEGIVLDKERVHSSMPASITDAKIALIDAALEIKNTETDAKISITDPQQMQSFLDMEERMLKNLVEDLAKSGANVVICQKGIDDLAQHFLARKGIFALRRIKKTDMDKLAKATGATIISDYKDLRPAHLGKAAIVEEQKIGEEAMTYVRGCKHPRSVTLLVRGGSEHVVAEIKRALQDAIGDVASARRNSLVVGGAGAPELEVARGLRLYADTLSGRERLAVTAFAQSLEVIPRTLSENAGLDPIDLMAQLHAAHEKGKTWAGVNVFSGKVMDAWKSGVIEPLQIKTQALSSAAEVAILILRIDDVIINAQPEAEHHPQID